MEKIADVHVIGLRSKTKLTAEVLSAAKRLLAIGCFCIGTNQVDLDAAARMGVPVFNSPFSNSRSVAELAMSHIVQLARQTADRNREMHAGIWQKVSSRCFEVRGKTLGIIGYGHIGSQLSVLAEAFGLRVQFYDVLDIMPLGNAIPLESLEELLSTSDFVTIHVPDLPSTRGLIGAEQIALMQDGAYLLNLARGTVVDVEAAAAALKSKKLGGGAFDVYPSEPGKNGEWWTGYRDCPNTILTPHIGGSTEEAQQKIGQEVSTKLINFVNAGITASAVNFPEVNFTKMPTAHRIVNVHQNVPGVMKKINNLINSSEYNITNMNLATMGEIAYLVLDVDKAASQELAGGIKALDESLSTRVLF